MKVVKKILGIGLISVTALSLSGCGFTPLPDEERYSRIDSVKNKIDFESAGQIVEEDYSGDGVFSGSIYEITIKGEDSFEKIAPQVLNAASDSSNCDVDKTSVICIRRNNPSIRLYNNGNTTTLTLTDSLGGRSEK